jgi:predicted 3-demethylubiquinone-9 3-methyltransferase (glyoxalase superfamily)
MQKITPFLWFDDQAEQAAKFYTSVFKNSKVGRILRYDETSAKAAGRPAGSVLTIEFEIKVKNSRRSTVVRSSNSMNRSRSL